MKWIYYTPVFECDEVNIDLLRYSPWSGHRNFIYDLMANWKPKTVVELGSYYGCSSFAIAQAIKDQHLPSLFYGVDTWSGDDFTQLDYKQDIFNEFCRVRDTCYSESYIKMLRMTFNDAVNEFEDNSIDLLHIDGSHHYEDVKSDFYTWKRKMAQEGIILFHDISPDKISNEVMGSFHFWKELKKGHPWCLQFDFSMGLGILFLSEKTYQSFIKSFDLIHYQTINNTLDVNLKDELRKYHFRLADQQTFISSLQEQLEIKDSHLLRYEKDVQEKDQYITKLENDIKDVHLSYGKTITEKDSYIQKLSSDLFSIHEAYKKTISGKDAYIARLESSAESIRSPYEQTIAEKNKYIHKLVSDLGAVRKAYEETISGKDDYIRKLENSARDVQIPYEQTIARKDDYIQNLSSNLNNIRNSYEKTIAGKEAYISQLEHDIKEAQIFCKKSLQEKDDCIHMLTASTNALQCDCEKKLHEKDLYISNLEQSLVECKHSIENLEANACIHEKNLAELTTKYCSTWQYKMSRMISKFKKQE